jgi:glycosyltransferase involved in cell wall biosynthesis
MRIGIDCLRVDPEYFGGLNTYVLGVLDGFAAVGQDYDFLLFLNRGNEGFFEQYAGLSNFETVVVDDRSLWLRQSLCRAALLSGSSGIYCFACGLMFEPIREKLDAACDVIYTPTVALLCLNNCKPTLLSMHDIQHVHYPEFLSWPRRLSRRITYDLSASYANYFQASSNFIKQDMLANYRQISPEQIEVIPEGVNLREFALPRDTAPIAIRYELPERFLFLPAQLWPHKNHLTVLKALRQIEERHGLRIPLVLTGAKYAGAPAIFRLLVEQKMDYVRYLGRVSFDDLVGLYQSASFLVSAGLYESNSLPVLEAAAAGTPIIASDIPPNRELAATLQLNLFDPLNVEQLAQVIMQLWGERGTATEQALHNRTHIVGYGWENVARKYLRLLDRIAFS